MVAFESKSYTIIDECNTKCFTLYLRSDGIIQMNTTDDAFFTIVEAKEYVKKLKEISKGIPHLILKVPGKHATIDTETRLYMATPEALSFSIAEAVIIQNVAQRIIGNFYIKFDKPLKPIKLFEKVDEAEKWLKNFR